MTMPPMGADGPQLWMTVEDVFSIKGRGTVLTGQLQGDGQLSAGDALLCDGERWDVSGIEQFGRVVKAAAPGADVGVLLRNAPAPAMLRGKMIWFEPGARTGAPFPAAAPKKRRWRG
jgi:elongation factor Tu